MKKLIIGADKRSNIALIVDSSANCGNTHFITVVLVQYLELVHGSDEGADGHEDVLKDQFDEGSFVIVSVATAMNNAHLLDEGAFA